MDPSNTRYPPETTPLFLRGLLFAFGLGGVLSGLFFRPAALSLGLSWPGILQGKFWQLATWPFVLGSPLSWWSLLFLALELLFIWLYSASILDQKGNKSFFALIAGSTLAAGLLTLSLQSPTPLTGMAPIFFSILIVWLLMNQGATLLILGYSVKASVMILGFIGFDLLIHVSQENWVPCVANFGGALFGWFYCKAPGWLRRRPKLARQAKIYDIRSGKPVLDDDKFMDAMLERISLYGEHSLTPEETRRMQQISRKK